MTMSLQRSSRGGALRDQNNTPADAGTSPASPSFRDSLREYEEMNETAHPVDRLLSLRQVMEIVGLRQTAIYELIRRGTFPRQLKPMGGRCSRWSESEVKAWLQNLRDAR